MTSDAAALDEEAGEKVDGRRARRERNRDAVIDAVLEMFADEMLFPTIEKAAERSGLSLRSVYRYFPDPEALFEATIDRQWAISSPLSHLEAIGEGPFLERVDAFVATRIRLFEHIGPTYRATLHHQEKHPGVRADLARTRGALSEQFEQQFARELDALPADARRRALAVGDLLTQGEAYDLLRRYHGMGVAEATEAMAVGLCAALRPVG